MQQAKCRAQEEVKRGKEDSRSAMEWILQMDKAQTGGGTSGEK